jgi:hypothetical protein
LERYFLEEEREEEKAIRLLAFASLRGKRAALFDHLVGGRCANLCEPAKPKTFKAAWRTRSVQLWLPTDAANLP